MSCWQTGSSLERDIYDISGCFIIVLILLFIPLRYFSIKTETPALCGAPVGGARTTMYVPFDRTITLATQMIKDLKTSAIFLKTILTGLNFLCVIPHAIRELIGLIWNRISITTFTKGLQMLTWFTFTGNIFFVFDSSVTYIVQVVLTLYQHKHTFISLSLLCMITSWYIASSLFFTKGLFDGWPKNGIRNCIVMQIWS